MTALWNGLRNRESGTVRLVFAVVVGFLGGLVIVALRGVLVPDYFSRDANKIQRIAAGTYGPISDHSFTPVAIVYRVLGLADAPNLAAFLGYLLAAAALVVAVWRSNRSEAGWLVSLYIMGSFALAAVYLGQYSKDVFVAPLVILVVLLPRTLWWDLVVVAALLAYAAEFRSYWYIVTVAYIGYRLLTLRQVRVRWLVLMGALGAAAVGLAFFVVLHVSPDHFRSTVQVSARAVIHSTIQTVTGLPDPLGGMINVFVTYFLLLVPFLLPFTAGVVYVVAVVAVAFVRILPLIAARSAAAWPRQGTRGGTFVRRGLSLLLALGLVQALYEPDYGSELRHVTPLLPLAVLVALSVRPGRRWSSGAPFWSWSGRPARPSLSEDPASE